MVTTNKERSYFSLLKLCHVRLLILLLLLLAVVVASTVAVAAAAADLLPAYATENSSMNIRKRQCNPIPILQITPTRSFIVSAVPAAQVTSHNGTCESTVTPPHCATVDSQVK